MILEDHKKIFRFFTLAIIIIAVFGFIPHLLAQEPVPLNPATYSPISPIPGVTGTGCVDDGFGGCEPSSANQTPESYLQNVFQFGIGVAAVLAVIMLIICGLQYLTTESFSGKGGAKQCIWAAVGGLMLVFISWIILNTINPDLLRFDFTSIRDAGKALPTSPGNENEEGGGDIFDESDFGGTGLRSGSTHPDATGTSGATTLGRLLYVPKSGSTPCTTTYSRTMTYNEKIYNFVQQGSGPATAPGWPSGASACIFAETGEQASSASQQPASQQKTTVAPREEWCYRWETNYFVGCGIPVRTTCQNSEVTCNLDRAKTQCPVSECYPLQSSENVFLPQP